MPLRITSATNPLKRKVLAELRRKKITVEQAARKASVPVSGILGWMRLAKIAIPEKHAGPRRRQAGPA
jgi:hypothetical protein